MKSHDFNDIHTLGSRNAHADFGVLPQEGLAAIGAHG